MTVCLLKFQERENVAHICIFISPSASSNSGRSIYKLRLSWRLKKPGHSEMFASSHFGLRNPDLKTLLEEFTVCPTNFNRRFLLCETKFVRMFNNFSALLVLTRFTLHFSTLNKISLRRNFFKEPPKKNILLWERQAFLHLIDWSQYSQLHVGEFPLT